MICPDVVILSHAADEHALAVLSSLPSSTTPLLLDVGRDGEAYATTMSNDGQLSIVTRDSQAYDLSRVGFWWNRRPRFSAQSGTIAPFSNAQETEVTHFWMGVFGSLRGGIWCNGMEAHVKARNKLWQIFLARECGLATPTTLWSNDPEAIADFWKAHGGRTVIKLYEGTEKVWEPTRLLTPEIIAQRDDLRFSHSIVQVVVSGRKEHRVVIFEDNAFVVSTDVGGSRYPFDVRIDTKAARARGSLDESIIAKLKLFMEKSGLVYGAFDLRDDEQGEPIFLEVNPMGQFLYLDQVLDGEVLRAFCRWIEHHPSGLATQPGAVGPAPERERWHGPVNTPYFARSSDRVVHLL